MCCIVQRDISALTTDSVSIVDSSIDPERTHNTELTDPDHINDNQRGNYSELAQVSISMPCDEKDLILIYDTFSPFNLRSIICAVCLSG